MAHDQAQPGGRAYELSQRLLAFLQSAPDLPLATREVREDFYRICAHGRPLSIQGNFAFGQRVNIGAAQACKTFDETYGTKVFGGLYAALDELTACKEFYGATLPTRASEEERIYTLTSRGEPLCLIDFEALLETLEERAFCGLAAACKADPVTGEWEYCKFPQPSQILGWWIYQRRARFDGIQFSSTRQPGGQNIFLFYESDEEAGTSLAVKSAKVVTPKLLVTLHSG